MSRDCTGFSDVTKICYQTWRKSFLLILSDYVGLFTYTWKQKDHVNILWKKMLNYNSYLVGFTEEMEAKIKFGTLYFIDQSVA